MKMPSYLIERKGTDVWNFCEKKIVKPLMNSEIFCDFLFKPDEELLQKICGIFDVNSFEIRGPALIKVSYFDGISREFCLFTLFI